MFNHIPVPANHNEYHADEPGTLAYYATLLTDSTTEITLMQFVDDWNFVIATPEGVKFSAALEV